MTTTTNLIERLRSTASKGVSVWGDLQIEAANELGGTSKTYRQTLEASIAARKGNV